MIPYIHHITPLLNVLIAPFVLKQNHIPFSEPSGSRVISHLEHMLDYSIIKQLKESTELVEFLIVDDQVVQIVG